MAEDMLLNLVLRCAKYCAHGVMLSGLTQVLNQMNTQVLVRRKQNQSLKSQSVKDGREKAFLAAFRSSKRITEYHSVPV